MSAIFDRILSDITVLQKNDDIFGAVSVALAFLKLVKQYVKF